MARVVLLNAVTVCSISVLKCISEILWEQVPLAEVEPKGQADSLTDQETNRMKGSHERPPIPTILTDQVDKDNQAQLCLQQQKKENKLSVADCSWSYIMQRRVVNKRLVREFIINYLYLNFDPNLITLKFLAGRSAFANLEQVTRN
mgnify:CR=1 FL=1